MQTGIKLVSALAAILVSSVSLCHGQEQPAREASSVQTHTCPQWQLIYYDPTHSLYYCDFFPTTATPCYEPQVAYYYGDPNWPILCVAGHTGCITAVRGERFPGLPVRYPESYAFEMPNQPTPRARDFSQRWSDADIQWIKILDSLSMPRLARVHLYGVDIYGASNGSAIGFSKPIYFAVETQTTQTIDVVTPAEPLDDGQPSYAWRAKYRTATNRTVQILVLLAR